MSMVRVSVKRMGGRSILKKSSGESSGKVILGTDAANSPAKIKAIVEGTLIWRAMRVMTTTKMRML